MSDLLKPRLKLASLAAVVASLFASAASAQESHVDPHPDWTRSGSVLQWAIPAFGFGLTYWLDGDPVVAAQENSGQSSIWNWPGPRLNGSERRDFLISFVRMEVLTYALKYGIDEERPYHGGGQSFPSGHTAASFMGAEFIRKQYGWTWGGPALAAATWVGYTRVESYNHYWYDVVAGALVGVLANHDLDEIHFGRSKLQIAPTLLGLGGFAQDAVLEGLPRHADGADPLPQIPGIELRWRFGDVR